MTAASPLPPQQDHDVVNRPYPLIIERVILLLVLLGVGGLVFIAAANLPFPAWVTVLAALPLVYVVWATVAERIAGVVQLQHRDV